MTADASELRALRRVKRKNYFGCVAFFMGGLLLHCLVAGEVDLRIVVLHCAWSASFAVLGVCVGAGWMSSNVSGVMAGLISLAVSMIFVHWTGGPDSPYFPVFAALPFLLAMFTPTARLPTLVGGGLTLLGVVALEWLAGTPPRQLALLSTCFGTLVGLALFGSRTYRRMWDAQVAAQQERLVALERLAQSEHRRAEVERERAEVDRLVLVGQLAAGVAHEVNNPLAFVKANLTYLAREDRGEGPSPEQEEWRAVLAETQQGVLRIQQIVTDLRRFSRGEAEQESSGVPREALHEARRLASVRLGEDAVHLEVAAALPEVRLGQRHLVQVLLNLLINAADAVEMARPARPARIDVGLFPWEGGVRVVVEDNGPGIPEQVLPRIFEPFFTTKPPGQGTGLGLALCREYVTRAGGSLQAMNRPEGGARFVLLLPGLEERTSVAA